MSTPQTANQINDPQTGKAITSRHSALSELMIQNAELRAELEAWNAQFGKQLSHAVEERDRLKEQLRLIQLANGDLDASNRKLREQLAVLQSAYDSLSQMKEKQVSSRIEMDELRDELEQCRKDIKTVVDNSSNLTKEQEQGLRAQLKEAKSENARLAAGILAMADNADHDEILDSARYSLRDLLAPTIKALEAALVVGFDRAIVRKELARLRGLVEGKP